jgi:hypothetical protein
MSEQAGGTPKHRTWRRVKIWAIGFVISLAVGWMIERVTDAEFLEGAREAQADWIAAVSQTSPIAVAGTYIDELSKAAGNSSNNYSGAGIASPLIALASTVSQFFAAGGLATVVQLGLGALAVALYNFRRTKGVGVFFDHFPVNLALGPVAIVLAASLIGLIMQIAMLGALYALSWITGLAAAAAGATGVVGFCWYCLSKLGEKTVEHVATPRI